MKKRVLSLMVVIFLTVISDAASGLAQAKEYECEVMAIEGLAYRYEGSENKLIKEGDILKTSDTLIVGAGSYVDLSFDGDWKNTTRIEENSKVTVKSIYPIELKMEKGGIYAKLQSLPAESRFEVQTPTAIAAARGTEYRTAIEDGQTQVYNFSDSDVYVFGMNSSGQVDEMPTIVKSNEKTNVARMGERPVTPFHMNETEQRRGQMMQKGLDEKILQMNQTGRRGKIQPIEKIKAAYRSGERKDAMKPYHQNTAPPGRQKELEQRLKQMSSQSARDSGAQRSKRSERDGQTSERGGQRPDDAGARFASGFPGSGSQKSEDSGAQFGTGPNGQKSDRNNKVASKSGQAIREERRGGGSQPNQNSSNGQNNRSGKQKGQGRASGAGPRDRR